MLNFLTTTFILILCCCTGVIFYKDLNKFQKIFLLHAFISLAVELTGVIQKYSLHITNTTAVYNIYILIEFIILFFAAHYYLNAKLNKFVTALIIVTYTTIWTITIKQNGFQTFAAYAFLLGCIILLILFLSALPVFLRQKLTPGRYANLLLLFASFIYLCGNVPLFSFILYLINAHPLIAKKLFAITIIISNARYTLTALSFFLSYKYKTSKLA